jgi:hypothetical protein
MPDPSDYVSAVRGAIANDQTNVDRYLTNICPECAQVGIPGDGDHHMVGPCVVVGCEGYFVVDPNLVGIAAPHWQPTDLATAEPDPTDSDANGCMENLANTDQHDAR